MSTLAAGGHCDIAYSLAARPGLSLKLGSPSCKQLQKFKIARELVVL